MINVSDNLKFKADLREGNGTGEARELRRNGLIPAIIYGKDKQEVKIAMELKPLAAAYEAGGLKSRVVSIDLGKETIHALPREIQLHPVTDVPLHADFMRVEKGDVARIKVKVNFINREKSPGIKRGGVLNIVRREVELFCEVDKVPASLEVDLDGSRIGQSIHISHIALPAGVTPTIKDRDFTIATIAGRAAKDDSEGETPAADAAAPAAAGKAAAAKPAAAKPAAKAGGK